MSQVEHLLDRLDRAARDASIAEEAYRREAAARFKALEQERAFAFRRLNLVRSLSSAMRGAEDEAKAMERAFASLITELGWSGTSESQREVLERFKPVSVALWSSMAENAGESEGWTVDR